MSFQSRKPPRPAGMLYAAQPAAQSDRIKLRRRANLVLACLFLLVNLFLLLTLVPSLLEGLMTAAGNFLFLPPTAR